MFSQAVDIRLSPTVEVAASFRMPSSAAAPDNEQEAEELVASVLEAMSKEVGIDTEEVVHASVGKLLIPHIYSIPNCTIRMPLGAFRWC